MAAFDTIIKETVAFLIRCTGIPFFLLNIYARNKVNILIYHNPSAKALKRHLACLSRHFNFISLDLLVEAIRSKDWSLIPPKALVVTIDDGYRNNYDLLEVFKKYGVIPTIYISTQIVNTNRKFWWQFPGLVPASVKSLSHTDRLEYLEENFEYAPTKEYPNAERQALSREEIMLMKDFVDFQSHGRYHPVLTTCNYEECRSEIFRSKNEIKTLVGKDCKHFSFPNGDYTQRELTLLKEAGDLSARTIDIGWNDLNTDPYRLKAMGVSDNARINRLIIQLCGIPSAIRSVLRGNFGIKHKTVLIDESKSVKKSAKWSNGKLKK